MPDFVSLQSIFDSTSDAGAHEALIKSALTEMGTSVLVQVKAVHGTGASITGTVDVVPMVHQQDGQGKPLPHGVIYGVPFLRVQGGYSALIIDPMVGDIGFIVIAGRDMQNVIVTRQPSAPASFRMHSMSDCVYVGGFLNNAPTQYLMMNGDGVRIVSSNPVTIKAKSVQINCDVNVQGKITASGDVVAGSISLQNHTHSGVQTGSGSTGKPQ